MRINYLRSVRETLNDATPIEWLVSFTIVVLLVVLAVGPRP